MITMHGFEGDTFLISPRAYTDEDIPLFEQLALQRQEGVYLFSDMADTRSNDQGTNVHGLFGAIIVEAAGSFWSDPISGKPLDSGLFADIYHPAKPAFREYAVFFHLFSTEASWSQLR